MCTELIDQARKLESLKQTLAECLQSVESTLVETKLALEQKRNEEYEGKECE